ncbi:MAG: hypothetical protein R3B84_13225 [Zavarzinella sp.]
MNLKISHQTGFPLVTVDDELWPVDSVAVLSTPNQMPDIYRRMLAHHYHMTVVVEEHYGKPVEVRVLESGRQGDIYHRHIILTLAGTDRVVQYGIVRIDLDCCTPTVRDAIVAEQTPLGRILIENQVLRTIEPTGFLKVTPGPTLVQSLQLPAPTTLYGRTGVIFCDNRPAIAVLEILTPTE